MDRQVSSVTGDVNLSLIQTTAVGISIVCRALADTSDSVLLLTLSFFRLFSITLSELNFLFSFFFHGVPVTFLYNSMLSFVCLIISADFERSFKCWLSSWIF